MDCERMARKKTGKAGDSKVRFRESFNREVDKTLGREIKPKTSTTESTGAKGPIKKNKK